MFVAVLPVVTSPPIRNVHFQMPGSTFRTEYSIPRCSNCNFPSNQPWPGLARGAGCVHSKRSSWQVSLSGQILGAAIWVGRC